jgi:hypothetical protein
MEYRVLIQIPGVTLADEPSWERLIAWLESNHGDMGPVISWDSHTTARITVATNAEDAAGAAELASCAVARALHASDLGALYPSAIEMEPVLAEERAAA